jgi:hypothetical protein
MLDFFLILPVGLYAFLVVFPLTGEPLPWQGRAWSPLTPVIRWFAKKNRHGYDRFTNILGYTVLYTVAGVYCLVMAPAFLVRYFISYRGRSVEFYG